MILRSVVFAMLACASLPEGTFASGVSELELSGDISVAAATATELKEPVKKVKKSSWFSGGCCTSKQVLEAVQETGRVAGEVAPVAIFEFGSALLQDLADDGKVNGSTKSAYAKAVADTLRAFKPKNKVVATVAEASSGLADAASEDLKDGKLNNDHSAYIKVLFREIERSYAGASEHEKEVAVLSSFILNLVEDLSDGKFDSSGKEPYIRDFNALMDLLAARVQGKPLLIQGLESAKIAFPQILILDSSVNTQRSIEIIQKALEPFHIANAKSVQERRQNLAVSAIDVVLDDAKDGHLDGDVNGTSTEYLRVAIEAVTLIPNQDEAKGDK